MFSSIPVTVGMAVALASVANASPLIWFGSGSSSSSSSSSSTTTVTNKYRGASYNSGCYADSSLFLGNFQVSSSSMSNLVCANKCGDNGYKYSGTNGGSNCYCSKTAPSTTVPNTCGVACPGDSSMNCGGSSSANSLSFSVWYNSDAVAVVSSSSTSASSTSTSSKATTTTTTSSSSSSTSAAATTTKTATSTSSAAPTTTSSSSTSSAAPTTTSSASSSAAPSTSSSSSSSAAPTTTSSSTSSSAAPTSTSVTSTAAASTTNIVANLASTLSVTASSSTTTSSATTTSSTAAAAVTTFAYGGAQYQGGCFYDVAGSGLARTFTGASTSSSSMTNEMCANYCGDHSFRYSGVEYGSECYCSNIAPTVTDGATCNMACSGAANENCGGSWSMSVYVNNNIAAQVTQILGSQFASQGCFSDSVASRTLTAYSYSAANMTQATCAKTCSAMGHAYSGTEYSTECYCGDYAPLVTSTSCTMSCGGDNTQICGGSNALTVLKDSSVATAAAPTCSSLPQGYAVCKYVTGTSGACVPV